MAKHFLLTISDVHHGAKTAEEMTNEFYSEGGFMPTLQECVLEENFFGVAITGDYFDKRLDLNDAKTKTANNIFLEIFNTCKLHKKYFIVLRGTYSHDFSQLDNFKNLELNYDRFFLVNTVTCLELENLRILCLPEEYMHNQEEFYSEYFSEKYNIILGHGMFKYNCFDANEAERPMAGMPIFDEQELMRIADLIVFGHIHTPSVYKNKIYYNGSYSRLCFGEEDPKGFWLFEYDSKTKKHEADFIENTLAPTYTTVPLSSLIRKEESSDKIIKIIEKERKKYDNLRVYISKEYVEKNYATVELIKKYFYSKKGIVIQALGFSLKVNKEIDSEVPLIENTEYEFLLTEPDLNKKILKFIEVKYSDKKYDIGLDDIKEALSESKDE